MADCHVWVPVEGDHACDLGTCGERVRDGCCHGEGGAGGKTGDGDVGGVKGGGVGGDVGEDVGDVVRGGGKGVFGGFAVVGVEDCDVFGGEEGAEVDVGT